MEGGGDALGDEVPSVDGADGSKWHRPLSGGEHGRGRGSDAEHVGEADVVVENWEAAVRGFEVGLEEMGGGSRLMTTKVPNGLHEV